MRDAGLGDERWDGSEISATVMLRLGAKQDALPDDPNRAQYLDCFESAGLDLYLGDLNLLYAEHDGSLSSLVIHDNIDGDGYEDRYHLSVPVSDKNDSTKEWQPRWLEIWLYSQDTTQLDSDRFPTELPQFPMGWFRISFAHLKDGGFRSIQGPVTQHMPLDAILDPADQNQLNLLRLQQYIDYVDELERMLHEAKKAVQELQTSSFAVNTEMQKLKAELAGLKESSIQEVLAQKTSLEADLQLAHSQKQKLEEDFIALKEENQLLTTQLESALSRAKEADDRLDATLAVVDRWRRVFHRSTSEEQFEQSVSAEKSVRNNQSHEQEQLTIPVDSTPLENRETEQYRIRPRRFR